MVQNQRSLVALETKVAFLSEPRHYPDPTTAVTIIETHMSWVFVTDHVVYKLKKPVRLPFLDFSTLEARRHFCEESIRLNRRLAPTVYLNVVALTRDAGGNLQINGDGEPVEWLEKLQRLPDELMLDVAIREGRVTERNVQRFTRTLCMFYRNAQPCELEPAAYRHRFARDIRAHRRELLDETYGLDRIRIERITKWQLELLERESALLDARVEAGKVIEAHGDLRPEHVCLLADPVFIDCLEFNRDFRLLDIADELSYLALECEFAGGSFIGPVMFATYEQETGDQIPQMLAHFYKSYRALLRAKLAAWHIKDHPIAVHPKWLRRATAYLDLAEHYGKMLVPADQSARAQSSSSSTIDPPS